MTIGLITVAAIVATSALILLVTRQYEPPPNLTPTRALRYLLMCAGMFLVSLVALQDPLMQDVGRGGLVASMIALAGLVAVMVDAVRMEASNV
jgi:hypothetical protein